jgi:hypothetical protein
MNDTRTATEKRLAQRGGVHKDQNARKAHKTNRRETKVALRKGDWR